MSLLLAMCVHFQFVVLVMNTSKRIYQCCLQCKTRYKRDKGSPQVDGDEDVDDVDDLVNELSYGQGKSPNNAISQSLGAAWNVANVTKGSTGVIFGLGTAGLSVSAGNNSVSKAFGFTVVVDPSSYQEPIAQVALGEASKNEKSKEPVVVYLKVGVQKLVLGTLNREEIPQIPLDLVLDQEAKLSHTCQSAKSDEVEAALNLKDNGKVETKSEKVKIDEPKKDVSGAPAKKVNVVVPKKDEEDEDSDDDDDDESDDEDESGSEMDADSDEDGSDEDEKTPVKKVDQGKKRPNVSATKTPVPAAKKAKNVTPEKFGGKKIAHALTPHPVKKGGNPNSAGKFQSPKTGSQQRKKGGKKGGR
ncbi:hypothetical protein AHAS_Ahas13G0125500 [Arachis hypogaea]